MRNSNLQLWVARELHVNKSLVECRVAFHNNDIKKKKHFILQTIVSGRKTIFLFHVSPNF